MSRDYIKAGPIDYAATETFLTREYGLASGEVATLLYRANASPTGMASRELPDGRRVWVSALVTMPGKYMIEME